MCKEFCVGSDRWYPLWSGMISECPALSRFEFSMVDQVMISADMLKTHSEWTMGLFSEFLATELIAFK